ncbi:nucleotidyltransferase domain-containing protein [Kribbella sp. NPDC055071]
MSSADRTPALTAVRDLFREYPCPYWVAGGWALDLFADRVLRPHDDVDVLVLARDLDQLSQTFSSTRPLVEHPETGERRTWLPAEQLAPGPHALVFPDADHPAPIQILLAASDQDDWVYHRGRGTVRKPLAEVTLTSPAGLPYLAPEIVLLFKSRNSRPKDDADFAGVSPLLSPVQREWLRAHIAPRFPDHSWLPALTE